jgi:hypothetical protein
MAKNSTFPMLPGAHWWTLREKFKQSIPGVVTDSYLAATLNMQARSARVNVLPYLRDIGLIGDDNRTQELAKAWRDDSQYSDVCRQIREKIYPEKLRSAAPDPSKDRSAIEHWFANHTGAGASAIKRMTQFFLILLEADVDKKPQDRTTKTEEGKKKLSDKPPRDKKKKEIITTKSLESSVQNASSGTHTKDGSPNYPGVSINLQIHISSDATPDQIDKIFDSMARHIYKK